MCSSSKSGIDLKEQNKRWKHELQSIVYFFNIKKRKRIKHLVAAESGLQHPACQIHTKESVSEKPGSSVRAAERPAEVIKLG